MTTMRTTTSSSSSLLLLLAAATLLSACRCATAGSHDTDPYPTGPWTPYADPSGFLYALGEWAVRETYDPRLHFVRVESGRYHDLGDNRVDWDLVVVASPRAGDDERYRPLVLADNFMTPIDLVAFEHYRPHAPPPS